MAEFKIRSEFKPTGDQPQAIEKLKKGLIEGQRHQTLLGVTGSGKTFTIANLVEQVQRPTLVIAHNKTLAAQLCSEFKEFFPDNAVEYFVSYYDYYQPEAYVPSSDTYIEKDSAINEEIDKLRHSATAALFERRDVLIVASVSCIYGLGDPELYRDLSLSLRPGMVISREEILQKLVGIQYGRNDISFTRGTFRVRGDVVEVFPASTSERAIRIELFGDEIERLTEIDVLTGEVLGIRDHVFLFPNTHYVTNKELIERSVGTIEAEMQSQVKFFLDQGKFIEAQRIEQRTRYDIEMLREVGFCQGIENYARVLSGRPPGSRPFTLIDFFPDDFLVVVDESHASLPQIRGMYGGDRSRKETLVSYGFRLPSALDNRPLNFTEFESLVKQSIYVSATPGPYEREHCPEVVEQIIRPTGLLDPQISLRPVAGQIDDLVGEINGRTAKGQRVLVTTLTKKMAEDLTKYLKDVNIRVRWMHSEVETLERMRILRDLRIGEFDVLVGINLLREGLDLPEVSLVAILDADKEGFLRSETALVQTIGRAARNTEGLVIMYADKITPSMQKAIAETDRRRGVQHKYNIENGIEPKTIIKGIRSVIEATRAADEEESYMSDLRSFDTIESLKATLSQLEFDMIEAAKHLQFERAAELRDRMKTLAKLLPEEMR